MASGTTIPIRVAANAPVFDLPILVARKEGLFADAGLNIDYLLPDAPGALTADIYNFDTWSSIHRIGHDGRSDRISALRPAIIAQAILSFDETLYNPHDLAGVEIAVNQRRASHYATLQLISASLACTDISIRHGGGPDERLRLLLSGKVRAATLMEPHLSLALKKGAHIVAMTFYRGADVATASLSNDQIDAYYDAINDAVTILNRDFDRYRTLIAAATAGQLAPEELGRQFVRYTHAETYEEATTDRLSPWMKAWESTIEGARH